MSCGIQSYFSFLHVFEEIFLKRDSRKRRGSLCTLRVIVYFPVIDIKCEEESKKREYRCNLCENKVVLWRRSWWRSVVSLAEERECDCVYIKVLFSTEVWMFLFVWACACQKIRKNKRIICVRVQRCLSVFVTRSVRVRGRAQRQLRGKPACLWRQKPVTRFSNVKSATGRINVCPKLQRAHKGELWSKTNVRSV